MGRKCRAHVKGVVRQDGDTLLRLPTGGQRQMKISQLAAQELLLG